MLIRLVCISWNLIKAGPRGREGQKTCRLRYTNYFRRWWCARLLHSYDKWTLLKDGTNEHGSGLFLDHSLGCREYLVFGPNESAHPLPLNHLILIPRRFWHYRSCTQLASIESNTVTMLRYLDNLSNNPASDVYLLLVIICSLLCMSDSIIFHERCF